MLKIILLAGYKRSGKDFVAEQLNKMIEGSKVMSFAEPLKDIIATTMGISRDDLEEYKNDETTHFRTILQRFGTDAMKKHFGDDVWADLLISKLPTDGVVIISDWRFVSEYNAMLEVDAEITTVRIIAGQAPIDTHMSERDLDEFTYHVKIDNSAKDESVLNEIRNFTLNLHSK